MRNSLAARLNEERGRGSAPKVMLKAGYNHMIRGANYVNIFDVGAMTDAVAALSGGRAFHIIVLPFISMRTSLAFDEIDGRDVSNLTSARNRRELCFRDDRRRGRSFWNWRTNFLRDRRPWRVIRYIISS